MACTYTLYQVLSEVERVACKTEVADRQLKVMVGGTDPVQVRGRTGWPRLVASVIYLRVLTREFQFGQKKFRFDSIRQSDKFVACTLIFK